MVVVGEASVIIRAIGDKLQDDIQKALDKASIGASKSGQKAGKNYSDGFSKSLKSNIDTAVQPIIDSAEKAGTVAGNRAGVAISDGVNNHLKDADLSSFGDNGRYIGKHIGDSISEEVERAGMEAGDSAGRHIAEGVSGRVRDIGPDLSTIGGGIGKKFGDSVGKGFGRSNFRRSIVSSAVKLGVLIPVVGALVGGVSALVSGLFAVAAAAGTASAALVAIPGAIGAIVQGAAVLMIGFQGVGDAISAGLDPDKAEEFQEALGKLGPEAQSFAKYFVTLKDDFTSLRDAASEGMFPGMEQALRNITQLFPLLETSMRSTGRAVGDALVSISADLTSGPFSASFANVLEDNNTVIRDMGDALGDLARTLVAVLDAAGPVTLRFSGWIAGISENLREMSEEGARSGDLGSYFEGAADVMALLGRITGNIVEGLYDIGKVAQPMGIDLLEAFENATEKMANFTDEGKNVQRLEGYFEGVKTNVLALSDLAKELGAAFLRMGEAPGVAATADALTEQIPKIEKALTTSINAIGPKLAILVGEIAELFTALEDSGAIEVVIDIFTGVAKAFRLLLESPLAPVIKSILMLTAAYSALKLVMRGGNMIFGSFITSVRGITKPVSGAVSQFVGLGGAAENAKHRADRASSGIGRAVPKNLGRASIAAGGLALAFSGVGDSIGLTNTISFGAAGAMVGPWTAAAGAIVGLVMDITANSKKAAEAARAVNEAVMEEIAQGSAASNLAMVESMNKNIEGLERAKTAVDGLSLGFDTSAWDSQIEAMKGGVEDLEANVEARKMDLNLNINAANASDQLDAFIKDKGGFTELSIDLKTDIGVDTLSNLQSYTQAMRDIDGTGEGARARIQEIAEGMGASSIQAQQFADDIINGVVPSIAGIPDTVRTNFEGDDTDVIATYVGVEGLKITDKLFGIFGNKDDADAKIGAVNAAKIGAKTGKILGNKDDFQAKVNSIASMGMPKKTSKVDGDPSGFNSTVENIKSKPMPTRSVTINAVLSGAKAAVSALGKVLGFASGGWVIGPGTGTSDSIPAVLSNGEFVVKAAQAAKYKGILESINSGLPLPKTLPTTGGTDSVTVGRTTNSSGGALRIIEGKMSIVNGEAYFSGIAQQVYDGNINYENGVKGMNG